MHKTGHTWQNRWSQSLSARRGRLQRWGKIRKVQCGAHQLCLLGLKPLSNSSKYPSLSTIPLSYWGLQTNLATLGAPHLSQLGEPGIMKYQHWRGSWIIFWWFFRPFADRKGEWFAEDLWSDRIVSRAEAGLASALMDSPRCRTEDLCGIWTARLRCEKTSVPFQWVSLWENNDAFPVISKVLSCLARSASGTLVPTW